MATAAVKEEGVTKKRVKAVREQGRPKLPEELKQSEAYLVRMTVDQKNLYYAFAESRGQSFASMVKSLLEEKIDQSGFREKYNDDIRPVEDTVIVDRLEAALKEKSESAGVARLRKKKARG